VIIIGLATSERQPRKIDEYQCSKIVRAIVIRVIFLFIVEEGT
jgi:hypothetical protein